MDHIGSPPEAIMNPKQECFYDLNFGEGSNTVIVAIYLPILVTCVLGVIPSQQVYGIYDL